MDNTGTERHTPEQRAMRTYVLKWRYGVDPVFRWFIRAIREDGSFWGEIRGTGTGYGRFSGVGRTLDGSLRTEDRDAFLGLINAIRVDRHELGDGTWEGLLAEGPASDPEIFFYYRATDSPSAAKEAFLKIIALLKPYMEQFEDKVRPGQ